LDESNTSVITFLSENPGLNRWSVIMLDYYNKHGEYGENDLVELIIASNFEATYSFIVANDTVLM